MKISELPNCPQWLADARTENADVEWSKIGVLLWNNGEFLGGKFRGGSFLGGSFLGGSFLGGKFRGGEFLGGKFLGGEFLGGKFLGGEFWDGSFLGGKFRGGEFLGGKFLGGEFLGGKFLGGEFLGGKFLGGEFWGERITTAPLWLYGLRWPILIAGTQMQIGCERHKIDEWAAFHDASINDMGRGALKFWRRHKAALMALCESRAAKTKGLT